MKTEGFIRKRINEKGKVSVVICTYNQEKYIKETLDSILSQESAYTLEIIICDDASTDSTPDIISEYANLNSNLIPVLRNNNLGAVNNFFDALTKCKGDYIMVCGGDDYYLPGKINSQIDYLEHHPEIGLLHSDIMKISENGSFLEISQSTTYSSLEDLLNRYAVNAPTFVFRRSELFKYIKEVNPENRGWKMEDLPMVIWFQANNKIGYLKGTYVAYRVLKGSISHPISIEKKLEFEKSVFSVLEFFQSIYPLKLSKKFIYNHHIKFLLANKEIKDQYREYCVSFLNLAKNHLGAMKYKINYLRFRYSKLNNLYIIINKLLNLSKR